jgi:hypothetical protein
VVTFGNAQCNGRACKIPRCYRDCNDCNGQIPPRVCLPFSTWSLAPRGSAHVIFLPPFFCLISGRLLFASGQGLSSLPLRTSVQMSFAIARMNRCRLRRLGRQNRAESLGFTELGTLLRLSQECPLLDLGNQWPPPRSTVQRLPRLPRFTWVHVGSTSSISQLQRTSATNTSRFWPQFHFHYSVCSPPWSSTRGPFPFVAITSHFFAPIFLP